jgi:hypothetical protein
MKSEKKRAISKVEGSKYLSQCRQCGAWIEVHPAIGQDMTIKLWEADFSCGEAKQAALFFTI